MFTAAEAAIRYRYRSRARCLLLIIILHRCLRRTCIIAIRQQRTQPPLHLLLCLLTQAVANNTSTISSISSSSNQRRPQSKIQQLCINNHHRSPNRCRHHSCNNSNNSSNNNNRSSTRSVSYPRSTRPSTRRPPSTPSRATSWTWSDVESLYIYIYYIYSMYICTYYKLVNLLLHVLARERERTVTTLACCFSTRLDVATLLRLQYTHTLTHSNSYVFHIYL